jgi:SAM-dependent methyltransferase
MMFPREEGIPFPPEALTGTVGAVSLWREVALTCVARLNMAGLRPHHDVLDVGCGIGRIARYLCDYLDPSSRYEGFDVMPERVGWCQEHISPRFPNFRFQLVSLWNSRYSPDASLPLPSAFRFPYQDESFDFVFAQSVFTHLMPDASANYLREIRRVLRPSGISFTTWFWFNDDPPAYTHPGAAAMHRDPSGEYAIRNPKVPEAAVGYAESTFRAMVRDSGLRIVEPLHPGFRQLQDACVAIRDGG